jgi:hypothetical protein
MKYAVMKFMMTPPVRMTTRCQAGFALNSQSSGSFAEVFGVHAFVHHTFNFHISA